MLTIDVFPSNSFTEKLALPVTWAELASRLGVSEPTVKKCRLALDRLEDPISQELFEEIRLMVLFCSKRQAGGGGTCTRVGYMQLKAQGQDVLDKKLKQLGII